MFSKYCNTYSEKEMIHWDHTSQVKQKPVGEEIFLSPRLSLNPFTKITF